MNDVMDAAKSAMAGTDAAPPPKEIEEIRTRKAKSGGYIHTHHHTHPHHHKPEEHVSANQDAMISHMMQNMGTPNPGEAEADAGQSGVPAAPPAPDVAAGVQA